MIFDLFVKNIGEDIYKKSYASSYKEAEKECDEKGVFFLDCEYIKRINEKTDAYPRILSCLLEEAERISEDLTAKRYALFLYKAMLDRRSFLENIKAFQLPKEYELFAFFCFIPFIERTYDTLLSMGIDRDIISSTVKQFEGCVFLYEERYDRLGMNKRYFDWLQHYVDCEILNINRLRFEIHYLSEPIYLFRDKESGEDSVVLGGGDFNSEGLYSDAPPKTESSFTASFSENESEYVAYAVSDGGRAISERRSYPKSRYEKIIGKGDAVLSVHIPIEGELSYEACKESYIRALAVFKRHFPSLDIKGFVCYSWMMAPELKLYMKPQSRILGFASRYIRFPIHTEGKEVLNFVFYLKFKSYEDLAEDTSLQRGLKKLYLEGGCLYEYGGIFATDKI